MSDPVTHDPVAHILPLTPEARQKVSLAVQAEIDRQDVLAREGKFHGTHILPGGPDHDRVSVLGEEVGEVNKALNEIKFEQATREDELYVELIQTAATAEAWAAAIVENRP
jgi:hypothetical protein